jgi:serine/threonine protein kinase
MRATFTIVEGDEAGWVIVLEAGRGGAIGPIRVAVDGGGVRLVEAPSGARAGDRAVAAGAALVHGDRIRAGEVVILVAVEAASVADGDTMPVPPTAIAAFLGLGAGGVGVERCERCTAPAAESRGVRLCARHHAELRRVAVVPEGYRVLREIAVGGMGAVYLMETKAGELRAVKQIHPRLATDAKLRAIFAREAEMLRELRHPRIVELHEFHETPSGVFCLVMEYARGETAATRLKRGRLPIAEAAAVVTQALEGVAFAHARGVVHRDLKPSNLILGDAGVKVLDFGLAKLYAQAGESGFTASDEIGGTPEYMSPEQAVDFKYVKPAADIYAMGATLYELVTGVTPHVIPKGADRLAWIMKHEPAPIASHGVAIPAKLVAVIERAMAREPAARQGSADELAAAIAAALD